MSRRWIMAVATLVLSAFLVGCGSGKVETPKDKVPPPSKDAESAEAPAIPAK